MAPSGAAPDKALNPPTRSDAATFAIARKSSGKSARPVFVDSLPESWCIDPELAEAAITPRTKAIVAMHLYSNLCEMDRLLAVGQKHSIPVIEDAAEAIGSIYHTHARVLAELQDCAPLPSAGSYRVVYDTLVEDVPADMFPDRHWGPGDNPTTAVREYPKTHTAFEVDRASRTSC
jgi:cephalosporin hydroxylase